MERWAVERLARELIPHLEDGQLLSVNVDEIENVERWRKAVRRAGRLLGYPARTALSSDQTTVCGVLERPVQRGEQAKVAQLVADLIFGPNIVMFGPRK